MELFVSFKQSKKIELTIICLFLLVIFTNYLFSQEHSVNRNLRICVQIPINIEDGESIYKSLPNTKNPGSSLKSAKAIIYLDNFGKLPKDHDIDDVVSFEFYTDRQYYSMFRFKNNPNIMAIYSGLNSSDFHGSLILGKDEISSSKTLIDSSKTELLIKLDNIYKKERYIHILNDTLSVEQFLHTNNILVTSSQVLNINYKNQLLLEFKTPYQEGSYIKLKKTDEKDFHINQDMESHLFHKTQSDSCITYWPQQILPNGVSLYQINNALQGDSTNSMLITDKDPSVFPVLYKNKPPARAKLYKFNSKYKMYIDNTAKADTFNISLPITYNAQSSNPLDFKNNEGSKFYQLPLVLASPEQIQGIEQNNRSLALKVIGGASLAILILLAL